MNAARSYRAILLGDPCAYCSEASAQIDHVQPRAEGGSDDWSNLTATCRRCNSEKGTRPLLRFILARGVVARQTEALGQAQADYEQARALRDYAIRAAARQRMSTRQIGAVIGLSFQRVAQIIRGE